MTNRRYSAESENRAGIEPILNQKIRSRNSTIYFLISMISEYILGEYLGRSVRISGTFENLDDLTFGALSHEVVFFWLTQETSLSVLLASLRKLIAATPLALFIAGGNAERVFDALLRQFDGDSPPVQIMTRFSEEPLEQCITEFFQGTWPSEDRISDWMTYLLITDDCGGAKAVSDAVLDFLR
jgi:hypothetical protein